MSANLPYKQRTGKYVLFLVSCRNTSGSLGEKEMLWEHLPVSSLFPQLFDFSQTFISVFITQQKHRGCVFFLLKKCHDKKERKQLIYFDHQNVNSLWWLHHHVNSSSQFCFYQLLHFSINLLVFYMYSAVDSE